MTRKHYLLNFKVVASRLSPLAIALGSVSIAYRAYSIVSPMQLIVLPLREHVSAATIFLVPFPLTFLHYSIPFHECDARNYE